VPAGEVVVGDDGVARCSWGDSDSLYRPYHDLEWGRPVDDDVRLFEKVCLEGFQSGLSWLTILRKRESFRAAFAGFDPEAVARFGASDVRRLMSDSGIVRNRAKIEATIANARRCIDLQEELGSFAAYAWTFEGGDDGAALSKDLRRRGWRFVGPTTAYAFMQAMGLVNDHFDGCEIREQVERERERFRPPVPAR
jgi:DNA-3-methyladenine glycosylase I